MEPLGGCGSGQEVGPVKEPEHVHIKKEPESWDCQYENVVKEEAWCVDEVGQEPSRSDTTGSCGVSSAAMLAGLYPDHTVKDELVLGPELLHQPTVTPVFRGWSLADIDRRREQLEKWSARLTRVLQRERAPSTHSDTEQDVLPRIGETERAKARRSSAGGAIGASERPVKSEVPDGSDGPAREYCEKEYIMQSPVLLRAESPVSLRARSQLEAACAVRLERLRESRTYCCDMCTQLFKDKSTLIRHIRTHYRCQLCNKTFMMSSRLSRHEPNCTENKQKTRELTETSTLTRSHCKEVLYTCDECGKGFRVKSVLRKHIQRNHITKDHNHSLYKKPKHHTLMSTTNNKHYHCSQCAYKTNDKPILQRHQRIHTEEKRFNCGYCDYKCTRNSHLQTHQRIHTGEKPFKCGYCEYRCSQKSSLRRHQRKHTGEKPFKCGYCEYRCRQKSSLQIHQRNHTGEKPFKCGDCEYMCSRKSSLQLHQRIHTGEKPFQCAYCDYKCSRKSDLQTHQRIHTGEKPFQCGYCDYTCTQKSHLHTHQRIHTGEKPFQCGYCDYQCNCESNLQTHQRIHTGENPFQCGYCDYKCRAKSGLLRHQKKHTGELPFKCDSCGYKCSQKSHLDTHQRIRTIFKCS